jgi:hypothetical protein
MEQRTKKRNKEQKKKKSDSIEQMHALERFLLETQKK